MIINHLSGRRVAAVLAAAAVSTGLAATLSPAAQAATTSPAPAVAAHRAPAATAADLKITVKPIHDNSAGASYVDLVYTNVSRHAVSIKGYAGLSFVAHRTAHHAGTQVGKPAVWLTNRRAVLVTLKPGQSTTQIVTVEDALNFGSPKHHTVMTSGFRVYVPGSRTSVFVKYRVLASTRHVAQLREDPIGARI